MRLLVCLFLTLASIAHAAPKIYDCFLFFNEWEVLEIRLNELYNVVDKFVIVEASESFHGNPKPFYFEQKKEKFKKFADKIIHIKVFDTLDTANAWDREFFQRNQIMRGLTECNTGDIVIISDVDEIVPARKVAILSSKKIAAMGSLACGQKMYNFFLNRANSHGWVGPVITTYENVLVHLPQGMRDLSRGGHLPVEWGMGWHFTSMGGYIRYVEKVTNYSHWDNPYHKTYDAWRGEVETYRLVPIDASFPRFVRDNRDYLSSSGLID